LSGSIRVLIEGITISIASVTTAYNAACVLPRQLGALLGQTRPLQEIVVVDNGSSDGTRQMLAGRYPQVTVLPLPANVGAAGAWAAGLEYAALKRRHDWIWTFDDDSVPDPSALETLLAVSHTPVNASDTADRPDRDEWGGPAIIAMLPVHAGTGKCYLPLLWRERFCKPTLEDLRQPVWFADLAIASGLLVRSEVVKTVGLPRADFFMDFFDFEYCLRARAHGYRIAVVTGARLAHEIGKAREVRLPGFSVLWPNHAPWREYYMSRNLTYALWWLYPSAPGKRFALGHLLRHAVGVLLFGSHQAACLRKMAQGFWDGRRARLGVRFRPLQGNNQ